MRKTKAFNKMRLLNAFVGATLSFGLIKLMFYLDTTHYRNSRLLFSSIFALFVTAAIFSIAEFIGSSKALSKMLINNSMRPSQLRNSRFVGNSMRQVDNPAATSKTKVFWGKVYLSSLIVLGAFFVLFGNKDFVLNNTGWITGGLLALFVIFAYLTTNWPSVK